MTNWFAIAISTLALIVSALTAWFTLLRKGDLRMTLPTVVFFGPDGGRRGEEKPLLRSSYEPCYTAPRAAAKLSRACMSTSNVGNRGRISQSGSTVTITLRVAAASMSDPMA